VTPRVATYPTIELTQGAAFSERLTVVDPDTGLPVPLTGYVFKYQFRVGRLPTSALLCELGVTAGATIDLSEIAVGVISWVVAGSLTATFVGSVWHDLRADSPAGGGRAFWWRGEITMISGVTDLV